MLKKTIKYENPLTGNPEVEEHFFHISKADLIKMEMEDHDAKYIKDGEELTGMYAKLQRIVDSEDGKAIMKEFEELLRISYGIKDGDKFRKSKQISDDFMSTEAYSQFFWDICTDAGQMADFINAVVPKNLDEIAEDVRKQAELRAKGIAAQAEARAAAPSAQVASPAEEPAPVVAEPATQPTPDPAVSDRVNERDNATPQNPVTLTPAEVDAMDADDLKSGLATGRFKLS